MQAFAISSPTVDAHVGTNATIRAAGLNVAAVHNLGSTQGATAYAHSAGGGLVGVNGAQAEATASATVTGYVGDNSSINKGVANPGGAIVVSASATNLSNATADGLTVGLLVAVGASSAKATSSGSTNASIGSNGATPGSPDIQGNSLKVQAASTDNASAISNAAGGGLISVFGAGDNVANAIVAPTTKASIGANHNIDLIGNLTVTAIESPEGDSQTRGTSGGISVGGSVSNTSITPTVTATVASGSIIRATGSVNVAANGVPSVSSSIPDYRILSANPGNETIQVNNHGLNTSTRTTATAPATMP